jgi:predicted flap endonuclease-1-like 5' DNA nuclease
MKNPPILIAVIGFFAALAGFGFLFFGLRVLGFDWFGALGDLPPFEHVGLWGWLAIVTGIVWLVAAFGLWATQPWARLFVMIIAGFALFEAVLAMFQYPGTGVGLAMAVMPGLILWYMTTAEVRAAFGVDEQTSAAQTTAAEPVAAAEPVVARAAVATAVAAEAVAPAPAPAAPAVAAAVTREPVKTAAVNAETSAPPAAHHMKVEEVEGISSADAAKLAAAGVLTTDDLLTAGLTRNGRRKLAEDTGIDGELILEWVKDVDLMRVPGVGPQYSDLLEAAGVDSPAELAQRNPANLAITVQEVVAARPGIVRRIPTEAEIAGWIEAARTIDRVVEH